MAEGRDEEAREYYERSGSRYAKVKKPTTHVTKLRQEVEKGKSFDIAKLEDAKKAHLAIVRLLADTLNELRTYDGILMSSLGRKGRFHKGNLVGQASELTILALFSRNFAKNEDILAIPSDLKADFRNGRKAYDLTAFSIYSPYEGIPVQVKTRVHDRHRRYFNKDIVLIGLENICKEAGVSLREVQERLILERDGVVKDNDELMDELMQIMIKEISQRDLEYDRKMRLGKVAVL